MAEAQTLQPPTLITTDTLIGDIVEHYPEAIDTLLSYGVHCLGCHVSPYESIGDGFRGHGMEETEIMEAIGKLNEVVLKQRQAAGEKSKTGNGLGGSGNGLFSTGNNTITGTVTGTITITDAAAAKIKSALTQNNKKALRISVKRGGCSGYTYAMEVDDHSTENDLVVQDKGVQLFIDQASIAKLDGALVDYVDTLQASGFKISNPQANKNCGCGKSFG